MDFKRKIALLILAGLLMSLFGSYMLAMEPVVIKDFNGQTVQLTAEQKDALSRCGTLKNMIKDMGSQEIPFEGVMPFITCQNLQHVANIIKNKEYLNQIANVSDCMELFKLADYLQAPDQVLLLLADHIYEPLLAQIKATEDGQAKADLEYFKENVESKLSYYPDFHALVKDQRSIDLEKRDEARKQNSYVLSFPHISHGKTLSKKLRSLEGIELLADCPWTKQIDTLCINYHDIEKVDLAQITKVFPALKWLQLGYNQIRSINYGIRANDLSIDLRNNPLESICIANPDRLKNVQIQIDKNCKPAVNFNPAPGKVSRWLGAFKAQSSIVKNRLYVEKAYRFISVLACSPWIGSMLMAGYSMIYWKLSLNDVFSAYKDAGRDLTYASLIGAGLGLAMKAYSAKTQIKADLAIAADKHVQIDHLEPYHHGNMRAVTYYKYPSKYEYNLFGKN